MSNKKKNTSDEPLKEIPGKCPTPGELGHAGWNVLHTAAAVFPYKPSVVQQEAFRSFLHGWSHAYACSHCSYHMRRYFEKHPPVVTDKLSLNRYMCEFHNAVNKSVGKNIYDCDPMVVLKRWHPNFPDMEDQPTVEEQIAEQKRLEKAEFMKKGLLENEKEDPKGESQLTSSENGRQRWQTERWRSEVNEISKDNNDSSNTDKSNFGAFASGWGRSRREKMEENDEKKDVTVPLNTEESGKRNWLFSRGNTAGVNDSSSSSVGRNSQSSSNSTVDTGGKVADDESDVFAVLKRLKACMVYCPENDTKTTSS
ncbi:ERV/ALR sulfhydryl oxidase domain [Trypanosoma melophagium]|uniref:ERV/ALR sulfhydryl oxidase domain n=1 Tax=Trypanosoma melophagium TaxID=715481 RepID=UPI003519F1C7|nr:ERV/ALR sulfhydryl oxidase domain [Trypanosoma melophagium]